MSIDALVISVYLASLLVWAIYIGRRQTVDDFFVMSRRAPYYLTIFSVVATWVGVGTTVATASSAYEQGISLGFTALSGGVVGVVFVSRLAPISKWFGDKYGAYTLGDFFLARFSNTARFSSSCLILLIYLALTAAQFIGLAAVLEVWSGLEYQTLVWFAAISTIIYTAFGGIKSDYYTDGIHFCVMTVVLFAMLLPITITRLEGSNNLNLLAVLPTGYFDPFAYGGVSFFIAGLIFGAGSGLVTMELWQRIFASRSGRDARSALMVSLFVIVLFYCVATFFGLSARALLPGLERSEHAIFALMQAELPPGLLGLGIAGFIAIMVSTINSTIMVASSTAANDLYRAQTVASRESHPNLLVVGRVSTLLCGLAALAISLALPDLVALSVNGMFMLLILLPSVVGGFFWRAATSKAAAASIIGGVVTLGVFMAVDPATAFVPSFVASALLFVLVSKVSAHDSSEDLSIVGGWRAKEGQ
ncbi:MAG TPA: sodium:solute symporter family protein [Allosphingosinicella sp.]|nr:sodium:solute symporter family protein [Allosphingosinicella sp.]